MPLGRWLRFWLSVQRYCLRILVARDGNFPAAAEGAQHEPASVRDVENDAEQARLRLGGPIGCPVKWYRQINELRKSLWLGDLDSNQD
jgi:hypothetical protein